MPMHASVPELVKRTISTDGTASMTTLASSFSSGPGAPNEVPLAIVSLMVARTSGLAWPQMAGPHVPT
jgi:hypothetical protein